jgi:2,3-bisphosphoglycerate-independent phosphoglycerate mutase
MEAKKKVLLFILSGFGVSEKTEGNAVRQADPEFLNKLFQERPFTRLLCHSHHVGLPEGQRGNSEVSHLNLGAGRVVLQDVTRINQAIETGAFFENPAILEHMNIVKQRDSSLHFMGLASHGGVHSHISHLCALLQMAKSCGLKKVFLHLFTDGRDASPTNGIHLVKELTSHLADIGVGKIATISGRYFAMDRDNRWDRIEKTYVAMVHGVGNRVSDPLVAIEASYKANITDEFILPTVIESQGQPVATIENGDGIMAFSFRPDRARQLVKTFYEKEFTHFPRKDVSVTLLSLTRFCESFDFPVAFSPVTIPNGLGEILSAKNVAQFRTSETEKYPHITYFMNGGVEHAFPLEERIMVPSPKVKTYDLKPEMAAFEIGDLLMEKIQTQKFPFIMANFANGDMVGHSGILDAALKAVNAVDCVLSKVIPVAYDLGYDCVITADHGNAEQMIDYHTGEAYTEHTSNPVPFCVLSRESLEIKSEGRLCDVAPTILDLMGIEKPAEMTGASLIQRKK